MFDQLSILFSLGIVVFVIVRAAMLDSKLPWFDYVQGADASEAEGDAETGAKPGRRPR